ncbi:ABC-2 type transport system permease protein [Pedobacter sp. UYEF25]
MKRPEMQFLVLIVVLVAINIFGNSFFHRFDFTADKRFTLTEKTKKLLHNNKKLITITVFLDGSLPPAFKRLQTSVKDLLADYKSYSAADVKIVFLDPLVGLNNREQDTVINNLYQNGIEATNLSVKTENGLTQKLVFPMAMLEADGKQYPVRLFQNFDTGKSYDENINQSIENLEYTFTSGLKKLLTGANARIGFTESNGELSDLQLYDALHTLSNSYVVGRVDLNTITKAGLNALNLMVIAKPKKPFTEAEKYKINYFVMNGGRVIWSIDQVNADLDSLRGKNGQMVVGNELNLNDMLFVYGVRINYNIIADVNCSEIPVATGNVGGQSQIQLVPWLYYPILIPDSSVALAKKLDGIKSEFPSTVDTIGAKGIKKRFLLSTSSYNLVFDAPKLFSLNMVAEKPDPKKFSHIPQHVAVLLEGIFPSVFAGRPIPDGIKEAYPTPIKSKPSKMVVIGDGDVFKNQVVEKDNSPLALGYDRYTQRTYGNKILLQNIVDYFTDTDNLITLRNKELKLRLLNKEKVRAEKGKWQFINVVAPLLLLGLFAIFQHYYRKYRYAR